MVVDLVTFRVQRGKQQEFEIHNEDWVGLMRKARGFIAQVLMRSADDPTEYHAEIRWVNRDYRDRFAAHDDGESKALAQRAAALLEGPPTHRLVEYV
jgi:heme-degrading monooxygenase HmoA